jgi:hypothetical protein
MRRTKVTLGGFGSVTVTPGRSQARISLPSIPISRSFELIDMQCGLCCLRRVRKMHRVVARIRRLVCNDQMMLGIEPLCTL